MNAIDVIQNLIALGTDTRNAYIKAKSSDKSIDWDNFLKSDDFKKVYSDATTFLESLRSSDLQEAIKEVQNKEAALLNGKPIKDLPTDSIIQYHNLLDVEEILVNKEMDQAGKTDAFWQWLTDDALPVLIKVAGIVIPLLR